MKIDIKNMTKEEYRQYCKENSEKIRDQKVFFGEHTGTMPFGYEWIRVGSRRRGKSYGQVKEDEAEIVREIFQKYATGNYTQATLADDMFENYPHHFTQKGHNRSLIAKILKSTFYIGKIQRKDGTFYDHIYPPLIEKHLFEHVQKLLAKNRTTIKIHGTRPFGKWRALLQCGECHCRITLERHKGHIYYHCTWTKEKHIRVTVNEEFLCAAIWIACKEAQIKDPIFRGRTNYINCFYDVDANRAFVNRNFDTILLNLDKTITLVPLDTGIKYVHPVRKRKKKLPILPPVLPYETLTPIHQLLINECKKPRSIDELAEITNLELYELQSALIELELEGALTHEAGLWKTKQP